MYVLDGTGHMYVLLRSSETENGFQMVQVKTTEKFSIALAKQI